MAGNRVSKSEKLEGESEKIVDYTLGLGNRLASWGTNGVARYNTAGCLTNMVSDIDGRELNLSWDERYQLASVNVGGTTNVSYEYNVLGQRISRIELINGVTNTEYYVHSGVNIVADLDENKELLRSYSSALGYDNIISMTTYGDSETNTYFYIRNHNNSVVALIDENGDVAESHEYSAYGEVTVFDANGNELEESALGNRYCFQGRELDYTTGLYNFRARYYDPETGRWLSKDPIGIKGGLNQYVFCGNNPVMFGDPDGLRYNKTGKGRIIGGFEFGGYAGAGGAYGQQVVQYDNGEIVTYGYVAAGAGLGDSGYSAILSGYVDNVFCPKDYAGAFVDIFVQAGSPVFGSGYSQSTTPWFWGSALAESWSMGSPGASISYQVFYIISIVDGGKTTYSLAGNVAECANNLLDIPVKIIDAIAP